jgi:hypothetical protein
MRDQNATLAGCQCQDLQVRKKTQAGLVRGLKINSGLATQDAGHNVLVEVGVCLEA